MTTTTRLSIPGHGVASLRLEPAFRDALRMIGDRTGASRDELAAEAIATYPDLGLSSAIRCWCVAWLVDAIKVRACPDTEPARVPTADCAGVGDANE